ncbi:MAG: FumA C-terminus/TtdB family hydratase beta subunit [Candidatus Hadarchaeum sp.]|uniref:FumA C-terminus/TtdB family hydratase beta subunit n=1 Tax=Candidatus Hadarchaeum sp. TaxID=2883567 RepID=UPI003D135695
MKRLTTPLEEKAIKGLRAGNLVTITGSIVTARDKAYSRIISGKKPPIDLRGGAVYHCGPLTKLTPQGWQVISAGPTTSARLDPMEIDFIKATGVRALIGKGGVGENVAKEMGRLGCIYLAFPGGVGVLAASRIEGVEKIIWEELGPEAIWVLRVRDFGPMVVAVDRRGNNLFKRL